MSQQLPCIFIIKALVLSCGRVELKLRQGGAKTPCRWSSRSDLYISGQLGDDVRQNFVCLVPDALAPLAVIVRALIHRIGENLTRCDTGSQIVQRGVDQMHEPRQARHGFQRFAEQRMVRRDDNHTQTVAANQLELGFRVNAEKKYRSNRCLTEILLRFENTPGKRLQTLRQAVR